MDHQILDLLNDPEVANGNKNNDYSFQKLIACVEELNFRRKQVTDHEQQIKQLFGEKHALENQLKDEIQRRKTLSESAEWDLKRLKDEHEKRLENIQDEQIRKTLCIDNLSTDIKLLKDELKALQLSKLDLEIKLRNADSRHNSHISLRDDIAARFTSCKQSQEKVQATCQQYLNELTRLKEIISSSIQEQNKLKNLLKQQREIFEWAEENRNNLIEKMISLKAENKLKDISDTKKDIENVSRLQSEVKDKSKEIDRLNQKIQEMVLEVENQKNAHLKRETKKINEIQVEIENLKLQLDGNAKETDRLKLMEKSLLIENEKLEGLLKEKETKSKNPTLDKVTQTEITPLLTKATDKEILQFASVAPNARALLDLNVENQIDENDSGLNADLHLQIPKNLVKADFDLGFESDENIEQLVAQDISVQEKNSSEIKSENISNQLYVEDAEPKNVDPVEKLKTDNSLINLTDSDLDDRDALAPKAENLNNGPESPQFSREIRNRGIKNESDKVEPGSVVIDIDLTKDETKEMTKKPEVIPRVDSNMVIKETGKFHHRFDFIPFKLPSASPSIFRRNDISKPSSNSRMQFDLRRPEEHFTSSGEKTSLGTLKKRSLNPLKFQTNIDRLDSFKAFSFENLTPSKRNALVMGDRVSSLLNVSRPEDFYKGSSAPSSPRIPIFSPIKSFSAPFVRGRTNSGEVSPKKVKYN